MGHGNITILVLAAGASSRMRGADKLLGPVKARPLLRHVALTALATGLEVGVTLPAPTSPQFAARQAALAGLDLRIIEVADATNGLGASLRAGIRALPPTDAVLVLLADMPDLDKNDLARMIFAFRRAPNLIHRATTAEGQPGHPVIFPPWARAALLSVSGDKGAGAFLMAHAEKVIPVPLPKTHATTDLDTPEDWAAWRAAQPEP